ncbi:MAG: cyclophilin family peptidyl-prolyl cis-trans isomerase [Maribacter sp.]|jgi:cyclophilin family peptidyl-prolyl cis-trans isomerase
MQAFKSTMKKRVSLIVFFAVVLFSACDTEVEKGVMKSDLSKDVSLTTELGEIIFRLSDKTPRHRNNFIKLVNHGFYDSIAFHRVIENFLVQTGNPETRATPSIVPETPYTLPAEIDTSLFHKRGAINAARMGDDSNPKQESSGTQFTIIQGRTYTDSTLVVAEKRINNWLAYNTLINDPKHNTYFKTYTDLLLKIDTLNFSEKEEDKVLAEALEFSYKEMNSKLDSLTKLVVSTMTPYAYPEAHRTAYKTIGGAAHLDQNYVVFGEVVKGMDVVDRIATTKTDSLDKPISDVLILYTKMIERTLH